MCITDYLGTEFVMVVKKGSKYCNLSKPSMDVRLLGPEMSLLNPFMRHEYVNRRREGKIRAK